MDRSSLVGGCAMRSLLILCMAVCLALLPAVANAAGQVSDAILGQLGLSAMHQMTDTQGMDVRGSGFATVSGQSWASAPLASPGPARSTKPFPTRRRDRPWPPAVRFPSRLPARDLPSQRQRRWHRHRRGGRWWGCRLRQVVRRWNSSRGSLATGSSEHDTLRALRGASLFLYSNHTTRRRAATKSIRSRS